MQQIIADVTVLKARYGDMIAGLNIEKLLLAAGPLDRAGVCCINMDYGTPDDNIFAMAEVVERYRRYGG